MKDTAGNRFSLTYYTGVDYFCQTKSARKNVAYDQSPVLVVLNLFNGTTGNMGGTSPGGHYGTPGNYSGIFSSPYLYAGHTYCSSSCP